MPRGKTALKSGTEAAGTDRLHESPNVEMRELDSIADINAGEVQGMCEPSKERELPNNIADISVDANTTKSDGEDGSLPRKPKRLFTITGSKKKDAKPKQSALKTDNNKQTKAEVEIPQKEQSIKPDCDKKPPKAKKKKNICQSYKRQFFDDDHPYEDPSLLVNNSSPMSMSEHNPDLADVKPSMELERPTSPANIKGNLSKSTESIKAAVKENHVSIMSETSIPRSIFATLVALLLSLIVFLAVYFLLHSHAVLSVSVAILVFVVILLTLGFMDGKRMKCLILLVFPSVCSQGGRLALYLMVCYFLITGPLRNMIGNVKTVRNSLKCTNSERPEVIQETIKTFEAAQQCTISTKRSLIKANKSMDFSCLQQRCLSVKDQFEHRCQLDVHKISSSVCNLSQELSCINETYPTNTDGCPKKFLEKYCQNEFHEILEFLDDDTSDDDGCGFLEIFSMLFPLLILFALYEGYSYENNYRTYNNFHNFFLTGHFQVIDQSRSSCDRDAVLPLRKVELRKHVRPATVCHLTDVEKRQLWSNIKTYIVVLLIALFIILTDFYIFRMFHLENNGKERMEADIVSTNISEHFLDTNTTVVNNNNTKSNNSNEANTTTGNEVNTTSSPQLNRQPNHKPAVKTTDICSVNFDPPGLTSKIILPLILSLLLLVILLHAHVARVQWYICSRLYEMREKERVFYLYNKILEDRVQIVEKCRQRMKCYHREMETRNSLEVTRILARQVRWISKIFKFFHINLRQCIICNDTEKPEFKICHGLDCSGVYCLTCSFDIDKKCLYCDTELKYSLSLQQADVKDISSKESLV